MESFRGFSPSMKMEEMAMATFNNLQRLMESVDEDQLVHEPFDVKPFPPAVYSSFTSNCHSIGKSIQKVPSSSTNASPRISKPTFSTSQIISFANPPSPVAENQILVSKITHETHEMFSLTPNVDFSEDERLSYNGKNPPIKRSPQQARLHVMAERKRRKKLRDSFIALSKAVPGIRKLDKATIIEDAMKHIKELEERVMILEKGIKKNDVRTSHRPSEENSINPTCKNGKAKNTALVDEEMPEIMVTTLEKNVLIKILCDKKYQGCVLQMLEELRKLHLTISNTSVLQFGGCAIDITFGGKMETQFSSTVNGIRDHLRVAIFQVEMS